MLSAAVLFHNRRLVPRTERNVTYARRVMIVLNGPISTRRWTYARCFGDVGRIREVVDYDRALRLPGSHFEPCGAMRLTMFPESRYAGDTTDQRT
jgi:hypothetical protein